MKNRYLVILDVDKTLIDTNYRVTSPTINSVIAQMKQEGHVFLINSNRALEDLTPIAKKFGLTRHIIGENGSFIYNPGTDSRKVLIDDETNLQVDEVRRILPEIIQKNFHNSYYFVGDTTDINTHIENQEIPANIQNVFILNKFRKYTISLHVKKLQNGELVKDHEATKKLFELVKSFSERQGLDVTIDYTHSYANLLAYPSEYNKATAFKVLAGEYPGFVKIVIGDDYLDKPLMNEVDYFMVVNNATEEVKQVADYVSPESVTKGVEQILLNLDSIIK